MLNLLVLYFYILDFTNINYFSYNLMIVVLKIKDWLNMFMQWVIC